MGRIRPEKVIRPAVCSFLAALYLCTPAHTQGPARQDDTTIKVNVRLVRMLVTVKDAAGQPVGISTSCGLGPRRPDAALAAMDRIKPLL